MSRTTEYSPARTITTTATREIQVIAKTRGIWLTLGVWMLVILGMIGFSAWQAGKDDAGTKDPIAVTGIPASALDGSGFDVREVSDRAEAERLVRDGDVDNAIVAGPEGWEVLADGEPSASTMTSINSAATQYANTQALSALGVSPEAYSRAMPNTQVTGVDISEDGQRSDADYTRLLSAFFGVVVIVFMVFQFAANIGSRVTAEKSSRVVELVLAAVRPIDFLAGKILGNVAFGLAATAALVGTCAAGLAVTGLASEMELSWAIVPVLLVSWLLAMLFFGALYAAAGSMVQRTEDLQSTQGPILILLMGSMYVPIFGWLRTSETWMQVFSWVPPFSIFAAPITYAAGDFTALQLIGSYTLAALVTAAAVWFGARIYRSSILNNGRKLTWKEAIRA